MPAYRTLKALGLVAALLPLGLASARAAPAAAPYEITGSIPGNDGGWDYATIDPAGRRFYLSHADSVLVVDLLTGKITPHVGDAPHGHKVLPLDDGKVLAVTESGDNALRFIDAETGATLASVPTAKGPDSALLDPKSGMILVAAHGASEVDIVDPQSRKAIGSIMVGGALEELAADRSGHVFLAVEDRNEVVELDVAGKTVLRRTKIQGCDGPSGLVFAAKANALVGACDGAAAVIDAKTLKVLSMVPIGKGPDAALYDDKRGLVLIPCGQSGDLAVLSAGAPGTVSLVTRVTTEKSARLGALDPRTGNVYLPTSRFLPPAPGQRRGSLEPGSFHLIVLSPKG